jgi:acyl dehydratase
MQLPDYESLQIGATVRSFTTEPISRTTLALYCGASGDHNPLHVDIDFAKRAGMPDVIAHGMLSMAYLGRAVTDWVPVDRMRSYSVRFAAMTAVGESVTCSARVAEKIVVAGERRVRLDLEARTGSGVTTLKGEAVVALE